MFKFTSLLPWSEEQIRKVLSTFAIKKEKWDTSKIRASVASENADSAEILSHLIRLMSMEQGFKCGGAISASISKITDNTVGVTVESDNGLVDLVLLTDKQQIASAICNGGNFQPVPSTSVLPSVATFSAVFLATVGIAIVKNETKLSLLETAVNSLTEDAVISACRAILDDENDLPDNKPHTMNNAFPVLTSPRIKNAQGTQILGSNRTKNWFDESALTKSDGKIAGGVNTIGSLKAQYDSYNAERVWTNEELALIPSFDDSTIVAPEVATFAAAIVQSAGCKRPFQNFLWRGITGYGKSTGVEMLACILHTPLLKVTCNPDYEASDYLSRIEPNVGIAKQEVPATLKDIDVEELFYDPVATAAKLLQVDPSECVEYENCPQKVFDLYKSKLLMQAASEKQTLYVETKGAYLVALENGYMVEIQEPSRIRKQGVLVGLNEFDRPNARIPLLNGNYTRRHPKALVFFTDNVGYGTCRDIDPSVLRRFHLVIDVAEMDDEDIIARVASNTGAIRGSIKKVMRKWRILQKYAQAQDLSGVVSVVELENAVFYLKNVRNDWSEDAIADALRICCITKATTDSATQAVMLSLLATGK